jgi:glycosyltransferase involved in cell wall biosynthesis
MIQPIRVALITSNAVPVETVGPVASTLIPDVVKNNKQIIFELALLAKAFKMADRFDVYHVNIGDGDIALPLADFVQKPVIVTLHHTLESAYLNQYYDLFKKLSHVGFVAVSRYQQQLIPDLNYWAMIYHGVDINQFQFDDTGGEAMMWAGRLLLFPVGYEEAFGLVLIEAMACGTPVVAWGRGAIPEIVEDGVTGWVVDPSLGIAGLAAAVERIYQLPESDYCQMRRDCRERVEKYFGLSGMVADYAQLYRRVTEM